MLLLGDWVTPHHNFLPTLDKPAAFYWSVASAFKAFGFSEWAARLPSVLAALGCLLLVYRFARSLWGEREALWSTLILLTSVSFFVFARVVIGDMTLSFFTTLALAAFFAAVQAETPRQRSLQCALMYAALGAGTLVKGLVAVALPAMAMLWYLLLTRRWSLLRRLQPGRGAIIYFAIVAPWYALAEVRNPGYLRYFLLEEHLARYATAEFERTRPWYFLPVVAVISFLPWAALLPQLARDLWRKRSDPGTQFLLGWALLPLIFFSFSQSQLPQYILPVFPAFALLSGRHLAEKVASVARAWRPLLIIWIFAGSMMVYFVLGGLWPSLAVRHIRLALAENLWMISVGSAAVFSICALCVVGYRNRRWQSWVPVYLATVGALVVFFIVVAQLATPLSVERGSKALAQKAAPFILPEDRIVFYDTYLPDVPFYLSIQKPAWIVQKEGRDTVMGSNYLALQQPLSPEGQGPVLFSFADFAQIWKQNDATLRVFVKQKNMRRMIENVGMVPRVLTGFDEYLLVSNR
jgi:4-amino-4-deoxy-L-arabinose transferase-like glycosyltransferase